MSLNLLAKTRFYLIGAIEAANDCGVSWRTKIREDLKDLDINWFDPCDKHFIKDIQETSDVQKNIKELRKNRKYDQLYQIMKEIRIFDLSMVDKADAVIFYFDSNVSTCGSWEEFFWAVRLKRPIFVIAKNGIDSLPLWLFACIPHHYFYDSLESVLNVLRKIDSGEKEIDSYRWKLLKKEYR